MPATTVLPAPFAGAVAELRAALAAQADPAVELQEVPAPTRMAPHAVAVSAAVLRAGQEVGEGRFVVLHDPRGQDGWAGDTRVVTLATADVEQEMAEDPALGAVGWSWLLESLQSRGARHRAAGGTVTRTTSSRFGALAEPDDADGDAAGGQVEVRASWTAVAGPAGLDLVAHLTAWCDVLRATAGLPPEGVSALRA